MRITIDIDDALLSRAAELTGVSEKAALVEMGLDALVSRASAARLPTLGGTENNRGVTNLSYGLKPKR